MDNVASELLKLALEAKTGMKQPERTTPPESDKPLSPDQLNTYAGYYATVIGLVKASGDSGALEAEVLGNRLSLVPRIDGMMGLRYKLFGFFPISLGDLDYVGISRAAATGREILLARSQNLDMVFGEKVLPPPISEKWLKRVGAYKIANPGDDIVFFDSVRIGQKEGFLVVEYSAPIVAEGTLSFPISPVSDTEAVFLGLGGGMGETIRAIDIDGEDGLEYSGLSAEKGSRPHNRCSIWKRKTYPRTRAYTASGTASVMPLTRTGSMCSPRAPDGNRQIGPTARHGTCWNRKLPKSSRRSKRIN